jgi:hypothetical protein
MLQKLPEVKTYGKKLPSESLADTVLREQLLDVLEIPHEEQMWFRKVFFDTLNTEFAEKTKNEALKQVFIERFYAFLARDGTRQDAFCIAILRKRKQLLTAVLKQFGKELEALSDPKHEEVLKPFADTFNARQKLTMPLK